MDDQLIDSSDLPLRRRSLLPGTGFFYPDSLDEGRAEERAREAIDGAAAVVVTDSDADGLGCVALIREAYDAALGQSSASRTRSQPPVYSHSAASPWEHGSSAPKRPRASV